MARFPEIAPMLPPSRPGMMPPGLFPAAPPSVSFTRQPASGTATIDALMARQKQAAAARETALATPQTTLPGGIGQMLESYLAGKREYDAAQEETVGREELAKAIGGYDPDAPNAQEQISAIYRRDPELGTQLMADAIKARRDAASREAFTTLTPEQEAAEFGSDLPGSYQRSSTTGKISQIGGGGTTVTVGGAGTPLDKAMADAEAKAFGDYTAQGIKAQRIMADMGIIDQLIEQAPQGPIVGELARRFPGVNSAGAAFQSIVKGLAPSLREPGSGSTSDIEYQGMLDRLPALSNYPEANRLISGMFKAKAALDLERANLVSRFRMMAFDQDPAQNELKFRQAMGDIMSRSIMTPELQTLLEGVAPVEQAAPSDLSTMSDEELDAEIARRKAAGEQ